MRIVGLMQNGWSSVRRPSRRTRGIYKGTAESLEVRQLLTVSFKFDYTYDTNGFFNTQERKDALEAAGRLVADNLSDTLSAITPSGSNKWTPSITHPGTGQSKTLPSSTKVAADQILVFVGGRNLPEGTLARGGPGGFGWSGSSAWGTTVKTRSESGVTASKPTDTAPWGGQVTFDTIGTSWHFGRTTAGLDSNESDFLSTAVHELGHVLGIGTAASWNSLISGSSFVGSKTKVANNNRSVAVDSGKAHFAEGVKSDDIEVAMGPSSTTGTRQLYSRLDFAAVDDIGWDINASDDSIYRAKHLLTHLGPSGGVGGSDSVVKGGRIESSKDVDFYRIYVEKGSRISVSVSKGSASQTTVDTYLRLYDQAGSELKSANQGGRGQTDSFNNYAAPRTDYYYIAVSSYGNRSYTPFSTGSGPGGTTGYYTVGVTLGDPSSSSMSREFLANTQAGFESPVTSETTSPSASLASAGFTDVMAGFTGPVNTLTTAAQQFGSSLQSAASSAGSHDRTWSTPTGDTQTARNSSAFGELDDLFAELFSPAVRGTLDL